MQIEIREGLKAFQIGSNTRIKFEAEDDETENVVEYGGIVTDDSEAESGFYVLQKSVLLIATPICQATNLRRFRKGHTLVISGGHRVNLKRNSALKFALILCGKSFVRALEELSSPHDDVAESAIFENDALIQLSFKRQFDVNALLAAFDLKMALRRKFDGIPGILDKIFRTSESGSFNALALFCDVFITRPLNDEDKKRNLFDEFWKDEDETCLLVRNANSASSTEVALIKDAETALRTNLETQKSDKMKSYFNRQRDFHLDYAKESGSGNFLVGIVETDAEFGCLRLKDDSGSVKIVFPGFDDVRIIGTLVIVKRYESVLEWMKIKNVKEDAFYVIAYDVDVVLEKEEKEKSPFKRPHSEATFEVTVIDCGGVFDVKPTPVRLIKVEGEKKRFSTFAVPLQEPIPLRIPLGTRLVLERNPNLGRVQNFDVATLKRVLKYGGGKNDFSEAYRLSDLDAIPPSSTVTIEARLTRKFMEEKRNSALFGLQLKCDGDVSIYITDYCGRRFVLGILPGRFFRATSLIKTTSKKGNVYFQSTPLTELRLIENPPERRPEGTPLPTTRICDIDPTSKASFVIDVTLECIFKLSVTAICVRCNMALSDGRCQFVGCHAGEDDVKKMKTSATLLVVDGGPKSAILTVTDLDAFLGIIQYPRRDFEKFLNYLKSNTELLYLKRRKTQNYEDDKTSLCLAAILETLPMRTRVAFKAKVRPFTNDNYTSQSQGLKLFYITST